MATCWCCGRDYRDEQLTRLGGHPEVGLCLECTHDVRRRALLEHSRQTRPHSPVYALRALGQNTRDVVIRHSWHTKRGVGPILRWVNRRFP